MKQIIRLNAVETPGQRSYLGKQISKLDIRQASTGKSDTLTPEENLLVLPLSSDILTKNKSKLLNSVVAVWLWGNKLNFLPKFSYWVQTEEIVSAASVCDRQRQQITAWITNTIEKIKAQAETTPIVLVVRVYVWEMLLKLYQKNQLAVNMTKTKSWLNGIWRQEKQRMVFSHSLFVNCHGNC
ncbi:MAG: hypothetical protein EAZ87_03085 [Nostocales cyanobacterium]|nr:MAG: hypothetical protein EAZ87_03085 [Nostocales cyanobacterium]